MVSYILLIAYPAAFAIGLVFRTVALKGRPDLTA